MFGAILEKAFAKFHGNYSHTVLGDPRWGVRTLLGAPHIDMPHEDYTVDEIWDALEAGDARHDIMQCDTGNGTDNTTNAVGLYNGHAYTILGVKKI